MWLPWALDGADRLIEELRREPKGGHALWRAWASLVFVLVAMVLTGHPQQFWIGALLLFVYAVIRAWEGGDLAGKCRRQLLVLGQLALAYLITGAIAAVQLIPFLQVIGEGNRADSKLLAGFVAFRMEDFTSLAGWNMGAFELNLCIGPTILTLGIIGLARWRDPRMRGLLAIALTGLVIGQGFRTPLFGLLLDFLPGLRFFRVPARVALGLPLALIVASSLGAGAVAEWVRARFGERWRIATVSLIAISAGLGFHFLQYKIRDLTFGLTVSRAGLARMTEALDKTAKKENEPPTWWLVDPFSSAQENLGMHLGYGSPTGYSALASARIWEHLHYAAGIEPSQLFNTSPLPRVYNAPISDYRTLGVEKVARSSTGVIEQVPDPAPRAWLAHGWILTPNWRAAVARLVEGGDWRGGPYVAARDLDFELTPVSFAPPEPIVWVSYAPERLELALPATARAGLLVVAETWYPGWSAEVDGEDRPVFAVNGWMRGIEVGAGAQQVVLRYRQPGFRDGLVLSAVGLLFAVVYRRRLIAVRTA
jgi:hypothetical protein